MPNKTPIILGLNCAHDASACLIIEDQICVAITEERLSRIKHQEGFPRNAIDYCLRRAGIVDINQVDCIVINQYNKSAYEMELQYLGYCNELIINPSHHLLHAYYAFCASGFENAAVLIVDGSGYNYGEYVVRKSPHLGPAPEFSEMEEAETLYKFSYENIEVIEKRWGLWHSSEPYYRFPSLGHMFSMASQYIFGDWIHAGKVMGLAPYGDSNELKFEIVKKIEKTLEVDVDWILKLPKPTYDRPVHTEKLKCDLAAKVQAELEDAMLFLADRAYQLTNSENLCLAGGVALNSVANGRIMREASFRNVFVAPAANDSGIAVGAALYGYHQLSKSLPKIKYESDFWGTTYEDVEIESIIQKDPRIQYEIIENPAEQAATDIAMGKIVGWFEGKSEFGPRALGHRSILCDPRQGDMKDQLNNRVKFREMFRPYAASVLEEHVPEYFDLEHQNPYMLVVVSIHPEKRNVIPAVCHVDGTCRIQTVNLDYYGNYRQLIESFYEKTSVPMVLNTSLNIRGEPIAETPQDALTCFLGSGMDVLYLGQYRISKITFEEGKDLAWLMDLVPYLNDNLTLQTETETYQGNWLDSHVNVRTRTGYRISVDTEMSKLLKLIDGQIACKTLLPKLNHELIIPLSDDQLLLKLRMLQERGVISLVRREHFVV